MADIDPDVERAAGGFSIGWSTVTNADAPTKYEMGDQTGLAGSVQLTGTPDSSTTLLQGSNDGSTWVTLKDVNGASISFTAAGAAEFSTAMRYIKPTPSGGGGSQDIDVTVFLRG